MSRKSAVWVASAILVLAIAEFAVVSKIYTGKWWGPGPIGPLDPGPTDLATQLNFASCIQ